MKGHTAHCKLICGPLERCHCSLIVHFVRDGHIAVFHDKTQPPPAYCGRSVKN